MGLRLDCAPHAPAHHAGPVSPQRMKASESTRLKAESSLRGELDSRCQRLQDLAEERAQALQGQQEVGSSGPCRGSGRPPGNGWGPRGLRATPAQQQEECRLLEQCRDLDQAVIQLTNFVHQNQVSLNRILLAKQEAWCVSEAPFSPEPGLLAQSRGSTAPGGPPVPPRGSLHDPLLPGVPWTVWSQLSGPILGPACEGTASAEGQSISKPTRRDSKGQAEESRAGELAAYVQESLAAMQLAGELAQREAHGALQLVRVWGRVSLPAGCPLPRRPHSAHPHLPCSSEKRARPWRSRWLSWGSR